MAKVYSETSSQQTSYIRDTLWNDGHTLIEKLLCSGYIADTFLRSWLTSSLRSDLSIVDRPNIAYHETILPQETYVLFKVIIFALF